MASFQASDGYNYLIYKDANPFNIETLQNKSCFWVKKWNKNITIPWSKPSGRCLVLIFTSVIFDPPVLQPSKLSLARQIIRRFQDLIPHRRYAPPSKKGGLNLYKSQGSPKQALANTFEKTR